MIRKIYEFLYNFLYEEYALEKHWIILAKLNIKNTFIIFFIMIGCINLGLIIGKNIYERINKKKISGKCYLKISSLMFFVILSFFLNLVLNYGEIFPPIGSDEFHGFSALGEVSLDFGGGGFNRVYREEWLRGIMEIIIYIPVGAALYNIIKKKPFIITAIICAVISFITELLCNTMNVSVFYYVTLCNNIIGALIGIGFVELAKHIILKEKKKIKCILAQLPLVLAFLVYGISYLVYFRHDFGNIYPHYYKVIEHEKINVSKSDDVNFSWYEWPPKGDMSFSIDELREYAEYYFSLYGKKIDDEKTWWVRHFDYDVVYWMDAEETLYFEADEYGFEFGQFGYNDYERGTDVSAVETQEILKDYGINIELTTKRENDPDTFWHIFSYLNEFSDGIYSLNYVSLQYTENGEVNYINCYRHFYTDIKVANKYDGSWYYDVGNPEKYYEIVSPQQAYGKLCAGEGYAEGLVEAADKGNLDIHVTNYHIETQRDDLNCLQYVYCFDVEPIEVEGQAPITKIYVPAMKINY